MSSNEKICIIFPLLLHAPFMIDCYIAVKFEEEIFKKCVTNPYNKLEVAK